MLLQPAHSILLIFSASIASASTIASRQVASGLPSGASTRCDGGLKVRQAAGSNAGNQVGCVGRNGGLDISGTVCGDFEIYMLEGKTYMRERSSDNAFCLLEPAGGRFFCYPNSKKALSSNMLVQGGRLWSFVPSGLGTMVPGTYLFGEMNYWDGVGPVLVSSRAGNLEVMCVNPLRN